MVSRLPPQPVEPGAPRLAWTLSGATAAARYQADVASLFAVSFPDAATFHDQLRGWRLGAVQIARRRTSARALARSRALTQLDEAASLRVILQVSGDFQGDYDGRAAAGGPGAIRVVDMGRPFQVSETDAETLELSLSHDRIEAGPDAHGQVFSPSNAMARLLAVCLEGLVEAASGLSPAEAVGAADAACALVAGLIGGQPRLGPTPAGEGGEGRLFLIARRYIDAQLDSRELTPAALGAHLGVSRRTLYRLFDGKHGVAGYIQQRRLDRAFDAIAQQTGPWTSLAEIAYAHGFQSEAHFSRAFRARFDLRPGEARALRGEGRAAETPGEADKLLSWLRGL